MATTKQLSERIEKLEQQIQGLGDLQPTIQQMQELLSTEVDIRTRAETVLASATEAQTKLATTTTQVDETSNKAGELATELARVKEDLERVEAASRDLVTQQQTAFSQAETERSTAFSTLLADKNKELDTTLTELGERAEQEIAAVREAIQNDKNSVEKAKTRVEEILGIVGEEALIGEYSKNATRDRSTADLWRWITAGSILLAILATGWLALAASRTGTNWHELLAKIVLAASLSGLAGYSAQQSSEHRKAQRMSETMASQLAALKPYLKDMGDPIKGDDVLSEVARKLFGPIEGGTTFIGGEGEKADNPMLVGQLLGLIQELIKKVNK